MSVAVSNCELRSVKYLAEGIASNTHSWAVLARDEDIKDKQDLSFVSFGLMSNCKSIEILNNPANRFMRYHYPQLVTLTGKTVISPPTSPKIDFGAIIKIHPSNLPERTWICCGGYGEWGT